MTAAVMLAVSMDRVVSTAHGTATASEDGDPTVTAGTTRPRPHVLTGEVADVLVRVHGSSVCSGTPIAGTRLVATAAHCVLDDAGDIAAVTVVRDGVEHEPRVVLVDPRYHDAPGPQLDAAVLIMAHAIPGPAATLGGAVPTQGLVTLAGFQPLDTDGTLLRGTSAHDRPIPQGVTGGVVVIESVPAGCVEPASAVEVSTSRLTVHCGLVSGASGGGLFAEREGRVVLLGIISTVGIDLSSNGVTPLSALRELLNDPGEFTRAIPDERSTPRPTVHRR
jgi:hypothetical protein